MGRASPRVSESNILLVGSIFWPSLWWKMVKCRWVVLTSRPLLTGAPTRLWAHLAHGNLSVPLPYVKHLQRPSGRHNHSLPTVGKTPRMEGGRIGGRGGGERDPWPVVHMLAVGISSCCQISLPSSAGSLSVHPDCGGSGG